jgi:hypothetical protein
MNRNASYAETLNIHEDNVIPFVKIGEPKVLETGAMAGVANGATGFTFTASGKIKVSHKVHSNFPPNVFVLI